MGLWTPLRWRVRRIPLHTTEVLFPLVLSGGTPQHFSMLYYVLCNCCLPWPMHPHPMAATPQSSCHRNHGTEDSLASFRFISPSRNRETGVGGYRSTSLRHTFPSVPAATLPYSQSFLPSSLLLLMYIPITNEHPLTCSYEQTWCSFHTYFQTRTR